ncbi:DUF805 domain-containing protein [Pseudomonas putida]|uniref:DUF805 domain-containing protein n=1 Tax=Pseudomonas putida TaxID=303 RepID=A0A8I1EBS6_PSEPU|nr:DUF805 domain-containing protein [Pseudomonas putida]MBI6882766.1 DUF805 domain-containing protein [Pseudomonas putida]
MHEYLTAFRLFAVFDGRTSRSDYWRFTIISMLIGLALTIIDFMTGFSIPDTGLSITGSLYDASGLADQFSLLSGAYGLGQPDANIGISGGSGLFSSLYSWVVFIPVYSVTARRLHDTGRSGWWALLNAIPVLGGLFLLVWMLAPGTEGDNEYTVDLSERKLI